MGDLESHDGRCRRRPSAMAEGRKNRCTSLTKPTVRVLRVWLAERGGGDGDPLFLTRRGGTLSRDGVQRLVTKHAAAASRTCPSVLTKTVTLHCLRHSTAVALLRAGVDVMVIALWLGTNQPTPSRCIRTPT